MAGKWDWIKSKFPKLQEDSTYQQKVDSVKNGPLSEIDTRVPSKLPTYEVEYLYNQYRKEKEELDQKLSTTNLVLEALTQLIYERYEDDGVTSKKLKDGTTLSVSVEPYPTIIPEKKDEFLAWVRSEGMESLLTLNYQIMAKIVKERLENGQMLPPGVDVFCRNKLSRRGGSKES